MKLPFLDRQEETAQFPSLAAVAPELPNLLQKHLDRESERGIHLLILR